jgi:hypothetical protein
VLDELQRGGVLDPDLVIEEEISRIDTQPQASQQPSPENQPQNAGQEGVQTL